eukprot:434430-Rhodomonas_salina.1
MPMQKKLKWRGKENGPLPPQVKTSSSSSSICSFSSRSIFTFGATASDGESSAEDSSFTVGVSDQQKDCAEDGHGSPLTQEKTEDPDRELLLSAEDELLRTQEVLRRLFCAFGLCDEQLQTAAVVPEDDSICTLWSLLEAGDTSLPPLVEEFAGKSVEQWRGSIQANNFFSTVGKAVRNIKGTKEASIDGAMHTKLVAVIADMVTAIFGDVSLSGDMVEKLPASHLISQLKVQYPLWEDLIRLGANSSARDIWAETRRQFRNSLGSSPYGQFILHKVQSTCEKSPSKPLSALMQALWKKWNSQSRELRAVYEREAAAVAVQLSTSRVPSIGMQTGGAMQA